MHPAVQSVWRVSLGTALMLAWPDLHAAPLTWFSGTPLNAPRSSAAVAVAGNVFLLGGSPAGSASVLRWGGANPPPLDTTRIAPGALVMPNGLIAVYGGRESSTADSALRDGFLYNPASDEDNLPAFPAMATARYAFAYCADAGGSGYAIGGGSRQKSGVAAVERFDPAVNQWTNQASLPIGRHHCSAVFDGHDSIYVFGGSTASSPGTETASVLRYSVTANSWSTVTSLPVATAGGAAVLAPDGKIFVIGGTSGGVITNLVQVYDPAADSWTLATPLPNSVSSAAAAVDGLGRVVVLGGVDATGSDIATVWVSQRLGVPDSVPTFTSVPATRATTDTAYTYQAIADGNPPPFYSLLAAPDGLQLDVASGLITWTPSTSQLGTKTVAVVATNYAGSATQTFLVNVVGPPPNPPTDVIVTQVNDYSATFTWAAATGGIGPATYDLYQQRVIVQPKGGSRTVETLFLSGITGTTLTLVGLAPGSSHTYFLTAVAAGAQSSFSPRISFKTTSPQYARNFRLTGLASTTVSLGWDPSPGPADNASYSLITSYSILERVTVGAGPAATNAIRAAGISGTSVTLTGLAPGSSHLFLIQAIDVDGLATQAWPSLLVTNPVPSAVVVQSSGSFSNGFQLTVQQSGPTLQTVLIEATSDLTDPSSWTPIGSVLPATSTFTFADTNSSQFDRRFYRVIAP